MLPILIKIRTFVAKVIKLAPLSHLSPPAKLVFLMMLMLSGFLVVFLGGVLLAWPLFHINLLANVNLYSEAGNAQLIPVLKFLQILQSVGLFILPPLMAGFFFEKNPFRYLRLDNSSHWKTFLLTFLVMFFSIPLINWMISFNEMMQLPSWLQGMERWMKAAEDQAAGLTESFLKADTFCIFLINFLMIAIIPAIGEEFLFRGVLQRIFSEWFRNIHVAIFLSAFLFAAIHMQFYGIIPRMMLGILFGYLFYWSGSLWVPIFAHFINNAAAVIASYLAQRGVISMDYENFGATDNFFLLSGSIIFTGGILYLISRRYISQVNQPTDVH